MTLADAPRTAPGRMLERADPYAAFDDAPRTAPGYMVGNLAYGLVMVDALEYVPELSWPSSTEVYGKMRHDPQISAVLNAYTLPIRSGKWSVDPAGCRPEVAEFVADSLGLPVMGTDDPGSARRRGVLFEDHLRVALLNLVFGFMPFAEAYDIDVAARRARLSRLDERLPQTITDIDVSEKGDLISITQFGEDTDIPARALLWYVHEREGANWVGRSMLRPAYGPWLLKHEMWRVLATSSRRFGHGVPVVYAPPGATPAEITEARRLATEMRTGDQSGAGMPDGFRLALEGVTGSVPDTLGFVRYLDAQMTQSVLATVLNLDASPNGSRALGETLIGLLQMSWAAVAKEITTPLTRLSVKIVDFNWGEDEPAPRICAHDINRPEATADSITALMNVGAITPDPELENFLRERYNLPAKAEESLSPGRGPVPPGGPGAPPPAAPPAPEPPAPPEQPPGYGE